MGRWPPVTSQLPEGDSSHSLAAWPLLVQGWDDQVKVGGAYRGRVGAARTGGGCSLCSGPLPSQDGFTDHLGEILASPCP